MHASARRTRLTSTINLRLTRVVRHFHDHMYVGHSKRTVTLVYLNTPIRSYEVHYVQNLSTTS